ncbi:EAL domain-containing protein, partial [Escherichia coli]
FDLRTRGVVGFEAAPRWIDPEHGEIPIERFLAIADEVGLIHALGERVLRLGCAAARSWPANITLSIDVHA